MSSEQLRLRESGLLRVAEGVVLLCSRALCPLAPLLCMRAVRAGHRERVRASLSCANAAASLCTQGGGRGRQWQRVAD